MDKIIQNKYESPTINFVEIQVEQGFATSGQGEPGNWELLWSSSISNFSSDF